MNILKKIVYIRYRYYLYFLKYKLYCWYYTFISTPKNHCIKMVKCIARVLAVAPQGSFSYGLYLYGAHSVYTYNTHITDVFRQSIFVLVNIISNQFVVTFECMHFSFIFSSEQKYKTDWIETQNNIHFSFLFLCSYSFYLWNTSSPLYFIMTKLMLCETKCWMKM